MSATQGRDHGEDTRAALYAMAVVGAWSKTDAAEHLGISRRSAFNWLDPRRAVNGLERSEVAYQRVVAEGRIDAVLASVNVALETAPPAVAPVGAPGPAPARRTAPAPRTAAAPIHPTEPIPPCPAAPPYPARVADALDAAAWRVEYEGANKRDALVVSGVPDREAEIWLLDAPSTAPELWDRLAAAEARLRTRLTGDIVRGHPMWASKVAALQNRFPHLFNTRAVEHATAATTANDDAVFAKLESTYAGGGAA